MKVFINEKRAFSSKDLHQLRQPSRDRNGQTLYSLNLMEPKAIIRIPNVETETKDDVTEKTEKNIKSNEKLESR